MLHITLRNVQAYHAQIPCFNGHVLEQSVGVQLEVAFIA